MQRYNVWNDGIHKMKINFNTLSTERFIILLIVKDSIKLFIKSQTVIVYYYEGISLFFPWDYTSIRKKGQYTYNRFLAEGHLSWLAFVPRNLFDCRWIICGMQ